jgi:molybdopterin synthase catalytic subunit
MSTLVKGPIKPEEIAEIISAAGTSKSSGGHDIFIGQVRDDEIDGKKVSAIEYSAYAPLVEKEATAISSEVREAFPGVLSVVILHSEGVVQAGELSLFVMVSAAHRDEAFSACRETVEKIKTRLPVWKKELFSDATHRWTANVESDKNPG